MNTEAGTQARPPRAFLSTLGDSMKVDPNNFAFPVPAWTSEPGMNEPYYGIDTRTWLAGLAMQGLLANAKVDCDAGDLAKWAVCSADALIAELNKGVEE